MKRPALTFLSSALLLLTACNSTPPSPDLSSAAVQCQQDLAFLPGFLLTNDTGATEHLAQKGQLHFDTAMSTALTQAETIGQLQECHPIIKTYLKAWRKGHLGLSILIEPLPTPEPEPENKPEGKDAAATEFSYSPQLEPLSKETLLLTVPTFNWQYADELKQLLVTESETLKATPNWILDVRRNGGGSDSTYRPLLDLILTDQYIVTGAEFLATPDNAKAQQAICAKMGNDPDCVAFVTPLVEAMAGVEPGSYVLPQGATATSYRTPENPGYSPDRVVVLIDEECGSSCEQFLLAVRQGMNVKLAGRSSYGALDYSNMRAKLLPSGAFELYYATSRSMRLPHQPVDITGIIPDIYLAPAEGEDAARNEVLMMQRWLETGSFERE
ncbi:S41 family peptidase [Shewanella submarina]|uniref:S41 family peptidase n=1 Tax=Shewanella submarina TaxID=2016376 RepID=A0ABV7GJ16_9GAMM|nr:S41 family peptidase [Shewanella submarina]MCL1035850.1 S41 family peptidase [Shewanella submarina]